MYGYAIIVSFRSNKVYYSSFEKLENMYQDLNSVQ